MKLIHRFRTWLRAFLLTVADSLIAISQRRDPDFVVWWDKHAGMSQLRRWFLIPENWLFNVYLHEQVRSDADPDMHDHPWPFLRILLRNSYVDRVPAMQGQYYAFDCMPGHFIDITRKPGDVVFWLPHWRHRIMKERGSETSWSLVITLFVMRRWGFGCRHGWVPWRDYIHRRDLDRERFRASRQRSEA